MKNLKLEKKSIEELNQIISYSTFLIENTIKRKVSFPKELSQDTAEYILILENIDVENDVLISDNIENEMRTIKFECRKLYT